MATYSTKEWGVLPRVTLVLVIVLALVALISFWGHEEKHEGVVLAKSSLQSVSISSPRGSTETAPIDTEVAPEEQTAQPKLAQSVEVATSVPKYGMDALGEPGAWDGGKEHAKKPAVRCVDSSTLSTAELDAGGDKRWLNCGHKMDQPDYFFKIHENGVGFRNIDIYALIEFKESGLWLLSDYEKLAGMDLSDQAVVALYGILEKAGSAKAAFLAQRNDDNINRGSLDEYLQSRECSPSLLKFTADQLSCR